MPRNNIRLDTPKQKEIYTRFRYLADRYSAWQTWADFVTLAACSLSLTDRDQRKAEYAAIAKRYRPEELQRFAEMFALTVDALEANPCQDFLGDLFMRFDLGNTWKGQVFTPYTVCQAMSAMTAGRDLQARIDQEYWIDINDPACGAGATLIAFAEICRRQNVNYQTSVLFVAQDVDRTAALMCFVQLALLGCAGYIIIGDSLTTPATGAVLFPKRQDGQEIWYLPMFFSDIWHGRRQIELMKSILKGE